MDTEKEFIMTGTLIGGLDIDLVALSGIQLTEDEHCELWDEVSERDFLLWHLECEEFEIKTVDCVPGMSDSWYEYRCGDKDIFLTKLRAAIIDLVNDNKLK